MKGIIFKNFEHWPSYDENILIEDYIKYVIQINGKKRGLINYKKDVLEESLIEEIKKDNKLKKYIIDKKFKKVIFVKNKLINIII